MVKVLIIDDEEKTRKLLKILISESNPGFEVAAEASNGLEGLELLKHMEIDVILTDIKMPLMDGIEFAEKALKFNKNYKILIVSAYDEFEYARKGIQIGVCDFILKPLRKKEIADSLTRVKNEFLKEEQVDVVNKPKLISQVKEYISNNIADSQLSLFTVAQEFFVNSSYLSRQFKKELGETFSEYLLRIRIEKSILYFESTEMKAYEISEKVGIPDAKYFGKCFKKITGKSIQEFKREM